MFEDLIKNLNQAVKDLSDLQEEAKNLAKKKEGKTTEEGKEGKKKTSSLIEPLTRLRSSVEEVKKAKENPEIQKIEDKLDTILEGIFK